VADPRALADEGVCFPVGGDDRRSTSATGRAIFADSIRAVDPAVAARIEHTRDWRKGYIAPLRDIVLAAAQSTENALSISRHGLASAEQRFTFRREGHETGLREALTEWRTPGLGSVTVRGRAAREEELSIPYRGRRLFGDDLRRQIDAWLDSGIAEPSFGEALTLVLDNPDWLDLRDVDIALLGAGAEMAPTRSLLRWGARVHAIDLPAPAIWERLVGITRSTPGTLRIPIELAADGTPPFVVGGDVHPDDDPTICASAGTNLITRTPEIRTWLSEIDQPFVLGTYAYADGADHVRLSMAGDAIVAALSTERNDLTLAFLATPTDVFAVPFECVEASREKWEHRGIGGLFQAPLRLAKQFEPNYPTNYTTSAGQRIGLNDAIIPQQGPNYILAKRVQRWRALAARAEGTPVSLNLAPATRTRSVVRNRALAAAYAGAGRFGVEVFDPSTSTTLMAALLVHDLRNPNSAANPGTELLNPMDLFARGANHGGLWRTAYAPRSVLGIAALLGMFESRA